MLHTPHESLSSPNIFLCFSRAACGIERTIMDWVTRVYQILRCIQINVGSTAYIIDVRPCVVGENR